MRDILAAKMEESFENYLATSDGGESYLSGRGNSRYATIHGGLQPSSSSGRKGQDFEARAFADYDALSPNSATLDSSPGLTTDSALRSRLALEGLSGDFNISSWEPSAPLALNSNDDVFDDSEDSSFHHNQNRSHVNSLGQSRLGTRSSRISDSYGEDGDGAEDSDGLGIGAGVQGFVGGYGRGGRYEYGHEDDEDADLDEEDSFGMYGAARGIKPPSLAVQVSTTLGDYGQQNRAGSGDAAYDFDIDLNKKDKVKKKKKSKKNPKRDKEQERAAREERERKRRQSADERMADVLGSVKMDLARERQKEIEERQAKEDRERREQQIAAARLQAAREAAQAEQNAMLEDDDQLSDSLEMSSSDFQVGGYSSQLMSTKQLSQTRMPATEVEHKDYSHESGEGGRQQKRNDEEGSKEDEDNYEDDEDHTDAEDDPSRGKPPAKDVQEKDPLEKLRRRLSEHMTSGKLPVQLEKEISIGDLSQLMNAPLEDPDDSDADGLLSSPPAPNQATQQATENDDDEVERIYRSFEENAQDAEVPPPTNNEAAKPPRYNPDSTHDTGDDSEDYASTDFENDSPREERFPASEEVSRTAKASDNEDNSPPHNLVIGTRIRARLFDWTQYYEGYVSQVRGDGFINLVFDDGDRVDGVDPVDVEILSEKLSPQTEAHHKPDSTDEVAKDIMEAQSEEYNDDDSNLESPKQKTQNYQEEDRETQEEASDMDNHKSNTSRESHKNIEQAYTDNAKLAHPTARHSDDVFGEPTIPRPMTPPSPEPEHISDTEQFQARDLGRDMDSLVIDKENESSGQSQTSSTRSVLQDGESEKGSQAGEEHVENHDVLEESNSRADAIKAMFWSPITSSQQLDPPPPPTPPPPPPPLSIAANLSKSEGRNRSSTYDLKSSSVHTRVLRKEQGASRGRDSEKPPRENRRAYSPPPPPPPTGTTQRSSSNRVTQSVGRQQQGNRTQTESVRLRQEIHELQLQLAASEELRLESARELEVTLARERELRTTVDTQKAEIFSLHAELKDINATNAVRASLRTVLRESTDAALPREEVARIEKEMAEQDRLLAGYQKENEKLVARLRDAEAHAEEVRQEMYRANMRIGIDLNSQDTNSAADAKELRKALSADEQVRALQDEIAELKIKHADEKVKFEAALKEAQQQQENASAQKVVQELRKELAEARFEHLSEAKALKDKLAWYVENQQLLEEHAKIIDEQQERIRALESGSPVKRKIGEPDSNGRRIKQSLPADLKRIRSLEKQVKELEEALLKRNPDCIANLILAAGPSESEKETRRELRQQIETLEEELQSKSKTHAARMRSLRQEHERVKLRYERLLEERGDASARSHTQDASGKESSSQMNSGTDGNRASGHHEGVPSSSSTSQEARILQLEQELTRVRDFYRKKIEDLSKKSSTSLRLARREGPINTSTASLHRDLDKLRAAKTALEARVEELEETLSGKGKRASSSLELRLNSLQEENANLKTELKHIHLGKHRNTMSPRIMSHPEEGFASPTRENTTNLEENPEDETSALVALLRESNNRPHSSDTNGENLTSSRKNNTVGLNADSPRFAPEDVVPSEVEAKLLKKVQALETENARVAERWTVALERSEEAVRRLRLANAELEARLTEAQRQLDEPPTPSMIQQQALTRRLNDMENRFLARERELELIVQNVKHRADMDLHSAEARFEAVLAAKNAEIRHFRDELDMLLNAAQDLAT